MTEFNLNKLKIEVKKSYGEPLYNMMFNSKIQLTLEEQKEIMNIIETSNKRIALMDSEKKELSKQFGKKEA